MNLDHYEKLTVQERAEYLLAQGVEAKLDVDPDSLEPGYSAHVIGVGKLPCGYHRSQAAAIDAGANWLREMAKVPENAGELE